MDKLIDNGQVGHLKKMAILHRGEESKRMHGLELREAPGRPVQSEHTIVQRTNLLDPLDSGNRDTHEFMMGLLLNRIVPNARSGFVGEDGCTVPHIQDEPSAGGKSVKFAPGPLDASTIHVCWA